MKIAGFQKTSLIDYPGKISCIIFTQGCMFRCKFCHNPELVDPQQYTSLLDEEEILSYLRTRVGKLDAVTITGGEPALHSDLLPFIKRVKDIGYLIKLDTTGYFPPVLRELLEQELLDYVAMDIKAPFEKYDTVTSVPVNTDKIKSSMRMLMLSHIPYEFRTTIAKKLTTKDDAVKIAQQIEGAALYVLQKFVPSKTLDTSMMTSALYSDEDFEDIRNIASTYVEKCIIR